MNETKWCVFSQLLFWNVVLGRLLFESSQTQTHLSRLLREKNLRTKVQAETSFIYNIVRVVFSNSAEIFVTSVIYTKNSSKVFTIEDFIPSFSFQAFYTFINVILSQGLQKIGSNILWNMLDFLQLGMNFRQEYSGHFLVLNLHSHAANKKRLKNSSSCGQ